MATPFKPLGDFPVAAPTGTPGAGDKLLFSPAAPGPSSAKQPPAPQPQGLDLAQLISTRSASSGPQLRRIRSQLDGVGQQFEDGLKAEFDAKQAEADERAAANRALLDQQKNIQRRMDAMDQKYRQQYGDAFADYDLLAKDAQREVDPMEYQKSLTIGETLALSVAAGLAELGNSLRGVQGENPVLKAIDMNIERNIRAQEFNARQRGAVADQKLTVLQYMRQAYGDDRAALEATKGLIYDQMATKLQSMAAKTENKVMGAKWLQTSAQLHEQKLQAKLRALQSAPDVLAQAVKRSGQVLKLKQNTEAIAGGGKTLKQRAEEARALVDLRKATKGEPLKDAERNSLESLQATIDNIDAMTSLLNKNKGSDVRDFGSLKRDEYKQLQGTLLANYKKSISGGTVSDEEAAALRKNLPDVPNVVDVAGKTGFAPDTIELQLQRARVAKQLAQNLLRKKLQNLAESGKDIPTSLKQSALSGGRSR